jgi:3-oxoacyl-[acyl-carrier protein] reductase
MSNSPIVLVTGSTSGIGLAIARKYVDEGYVVIQNSKKLPEKSKILGKDYFSADVTNKTECEILRRNIENKYRKIDILICNVGSGAPLKIPLTTSDSWDHYLSLNLFSTTNVIETFLPIMHCGKVVSISSICGSDLISDAPIEYSVAKAALNHYVQLLALKYASQGHMFNLITPGNVIFPGSRWSEKLGEDEEGTLSYIKKEVPTGKFIEPNEIAELTYFLTSSANKSITGSIIPVDGGQGL